MASSSKYVWQIGNSYHGHVERKDQYAQNSLLQRFMSHACVLTCKISTGSRPCSLKTYGAARVLCYNDNFAYDFIHSGYIILA